MKNYTAKIALISLIAAGIAAPVLMRAQDANAAPGTSTSTPAPKPKHAGKHGLPFHGTLDAVDANAMTLTVGSRTFQITSKTKIMKNNAPAVLSDGVVGEKVSGAYHTNEDGTLTATSVYFGAHAKKQKAGSDNGGGSTTSTNSVSGQ